MKLGVLALLIATAAPAEAAKYDLAEIDPVAGYTYISVVRMNDLGQVAGNASNDDGTAVAVVWDKATGAQSIPGIAAGLSTTASSITNDGQVVGGTDAGAFLWSPSGGLTFLPGASNKKDAGVAYTLGTNGQIGGQVTVAGLQYAAVWDSPTAHARIIGAPPLSIISGGGPGGVFVGIMSPLPESDLTISQGFVWSDDTGLIGLGAFGPRIQPPFAPRSYSNARDVNDAGIVVGYASRTDGEHAFWWTAAAGLNDMGDLPGGGAEFSRARAINSLGQVAGVGRSDLGLRAVYWDHFDGGLVDLNDLIDPALHWTLEQAVDLNERGQILGFGFNSNGDYRGFLLTPTAVPEPESWALLIMGLAFSGFAMRKRASQDQYTASPAQNDPTG